MKSFGPICGISQGIVRADLDCTMGARDPDCKFAPCDATPQPPPPPPPPPWLTPAALTPEAIFTQLADKLNHWESRKETGCYWEVCNAPIPRCGKCCQDHIASIASVARVQFSAPYCQRCQRNHSLNGVLLQRFDWCGNSVGMPEADHRSMIDPWQQYRHGTWDC